MKKLLLPATLLATVAFTGSAKDVLSEITSATGIDHSVFEYNDKGLVVRQDVTDEWGQYYMLFIYDEKGQLVRNEAYQDLITTGEFILVSYVDYQYDAAGHVSQRENYNFDQWGDGGFIKGGRITYAYDEQGRLSLQETYMDWGSGEQLTMKTEYSYTEAGLLAEEYSSTASFSNPSNFNPSAKLVYTYNEQGQRVKLESYGYDSYSEDPTAPVLQNYTTYTYSADGMTGFEQVSSWGEVNLRLEYTYSAEAAAETIYPYDFEAAENNFLYTNAVKRIAGATEYASDWDTGELTLYDTYTYHYLPEGSGVRGIERPATAVFVTSEGGKLTIGGLKGNETVTFVNAEGRRVATATATRGRLAVPALQSGAYVAVTPAGAVKFVVK